MFLSNINICLKSGKVRTVVIQGLLDNPSAMPRESINPWNNTVLTTWHSQLNGKQPADPP